MEQDVLERLRFTPKGEDPAFWPIRVLNELEYYLTIKDDSLAGSAARAIGEKYAPYEESIRRVKTAYSILCYPHCKYDGWKQQIGAQLESRRQLFGEDQVELNDQELNALGQITSARNIPFNDKKRVYSHSEVPIAPYINPFGKRHMTTEEIRKELNQNEDKKADSFSMQGKKQPWRAAGK
jgi:hypothetical protein